MVQLLGGTSRSSTSGVIIVGIATTTNFITVRDVKGVHLDGEEEVVAAVIAVVVAVELGTSTSTSNACSTFVLI